MSKPNLKKSTDASVNSTNGGASDKGDRIAKVIARAGLCSRREAEQWIAHGRVKLNGEVLSSPAVTVNSIDKIVVDGQPLPERESTRLWMYHKPRGLLTTNSDPEGRPTVYSKLPSNMPRVVSVGRLDFNTEGLLLLTNDGGLSRMLELPSTGWMRRYRVRAHGRITQNQLDELRNGIEIEGMFFGAIEAKLVSQKKDNCWIDIGLREGKNREIKRVLEHFNMKVTRLIRTSYGPFQLGELPKGEIKEVARRVLRDQIGVRLTGVAGLDFTSPKRVQTSNPNSNKKFLHPRKKTKPKYRSHSNSKGMQTNDSERHSGILRKKRKSK